MNKQILTIIMCIAFITVTSAMYAGECLPVNLSTMQSLENVTFDVVGNTSNITGLIIKLNETSKIANICPAINYVPDSFTIIFTDSSTKIIEVAVGSSVGSSGGGGGSSTKYKTEYIYRNVTRYIDGNDQITSGDTIDLEQDKDLSCGLGQANGIPNSIQWIIMVVIFIAAIMIFILFNKKIKGNKQVEQEELEQKAPEEYY